MTKIFRHTGFVTMLIIGIIGLLTYYFLARLGFTESKNVFIILLSIVVIGCSISGILSSIKNARSVYDKVLMALIGNIMLNFLFIIALYFVVVTFLN